MNITILALTIYQSVPGGLDDCIAIQGFISCEVVLCELSLVIVKFGGSVKDAGTAFWLLCLFLIAV